MRDALYDEFRAATDLHANLVQAAIKRAVEAVKGGVERWKNRQRVSQPEFTSWFMDYDKRYSTVRRTEVSLSTLDGRVESDFVLPLSSPTPYERYVLNEAFEFRTSTLHYDAVTDEFFLHVSTRAYDNVDGSTDIEPQTVLGIDFGVNNLAVTSTGTFWSVDEYTHWVREFENRWAKLHQRGTQAAHNALLRLGKRETE